MPNWIFTINSTPQEFERRINEKKWPIYQHTRHRKNLQKGDKVVFYMAGKDGRKFLGSALLASGIVAEGLDFSVELLESNTWKKPIPMQKILQDLKFIVRKTNWGVYFQGGVSRLPDDDYKLILSRAKSK